jgi:hypothetical protein
MYLGHLSKNNNCVFTINFSTSQHCYFAPAHGQGLNGVNFHTGEFFIHHMCRWLEAEVNWKLNLQMKKKIPFLVREKKKIISFFKRIKGEETTIGAPWHLQLQTPGTNIHLNINA